MKQKIRIDLISDIVCPWCIIGYKRLEKAFARFKDQVDFELHWHPFELNPHMAPEGENLREHLHQKYGTTLEGSIKARHNLTEMGKELGFQFNYFDEMKMYNTFQAHQLLHWAGETSDKQTDLKLALFEAYFSSGKDVSDVDVLIDVAEKVGLDPEAAKAILENSTYADTVRAVQSNWPQMNISAVPAFIFGQQHLIPGAQEIALYEEVIGKILSGELKSQGAA